MADLPSGFVPDLRALRSWPELQGSLWREPYLVEHAYGYLYGVVRQHLDPPGDVLEIGCGSGYMALELAREGCRVVAIDSDEASIELARRALAADPLLRDRDVLTYEVADVDAWDAPPASFDVVVASRVLHHVPALQRTASKLAGWLRPGGTLVCVEFGYDRFDRRCAAWLYQMQGLLEACGASAPDVPAGDEPQAGIDRVWEAWWHHHEEEHELHTYDQLVTALRRVLREAEQVWLPHLYWELLEDLDLSADTGAAVARFLHRLEAHLIAEDELPAVLFSWVGHRARAQP